MRREAREQRKSANNLSPTPNLTDNSDFLVLDQPGSADAEISCFGEW